MANRFNKFSSERAGDKSTHYGNDSSATLKIKKRPFKIPKHYRSSNAYNKIQRVNSSPVFRSEEEYKKIFRNLSSALKKACIQSTPDTFKVLTSSPILRSPNTSPKKYPMTPYASPKKYPMTPPASPMKHSRTPRYSPVKEEKMSYFSGEGKENCNLKDCKCADAVWSDDEDNGSPSKFSVSDLNDDMLNLEIGRNKYSSQITQVAANIECLSLGQMDYENPVQDLIIDLHPFETVEALLPHSSTHSSSNFYSCSNIYKENLSYYREI